MIKVNIKKKNFLVKNIFFFLLIILFISNNFYASEDDKVDTCISSPVFSLDVKNTSIHKVVQDISRQTGYKIVWKEKIKDFAVTIKVINIELIKGLRRILSHSNLQYYGLAIVEKNCYIEIHTFQFDGSSDGNITIKSKKKLRNDIKVESGGEDIDGIPPSPPRNKVN